MSKTKSTAACPILFGNNKGNFPTFPSRRSRIVRPLVATTSIIGRGKVPGVRNYLTQFPREEAVDAFPLPRKAGNELGRGLSTTFRDQSPSEAKSKPYQNIRYTGLPAMLGSFMNESERGIMDHSRKTRRSLMEQGQPTPQDSQFCDDLFASTFWARRDKNEARILRDISPLLIPSAENLTIYSAKDLQILI